MKIWLSAATDSSSFSYWTYKLLEYAAPVKPNWPDIYPRARSVVTLLLRLPAPIYSFGFDFYGGQT
jgi:hypothetical protein